VSTAAAEKGQRGQRQTFSGGVLNAWACIRESMAFIDRPVLRSIALVLILATNSLLPVVYAGALKSSLDSLYQLNSGAFMRYAVFLIGAFIIGGLLAWGGATMRLGIMESIAAGQRRSILGSAMAMPLQKYEKTPRGDLVSRLTADVDQSARVVTAIYFLVDIVLRATAAMVYMVYLSRQVGIAVIASSLAVIVVTGRTTATLPVRSKAFQKSLGDLSTNALNTLEGATVVKSFCAQDTMSRSFGERAAEVLAAGLALARDVLRMRVPTTVVAFFPAISAFAYGGYMSALGKLSPGSVLAMLELTDSISILVSLGTRWSEVQKSVGAYERVRDILESEPDSVPARSAGTDAVNEDRGMTSRPSAVSVRDLTFEYEPQRPVLRNVSLEIPEGAKVGIVGKSGCGKSTLMKLLAGLYAPPEGAVFVRGHDMHYDRLSAGRKQVTYMPQEPFLLSGTVKDNLTLSSPDASPVAIAEALEAADSLDFVQNLQSGLDAQVGERGTLLSGGQRHRLSVARGLLRKTPVLLLDEPTSSLDKESEARVISALSRMRYVTCLTVTHRAQVAEACDIILVMDEGRVVEAGSHDDLLRNSSLYWAFYSGEVSFGPSAGSRVSSNDPPGNGNSGGQESAKGAVATRRGSR